MAIDYSWLLNELASAMQRSTSPPVPTGLPHPEFPMTYLEFHLLFNLPALLLLLWLTRKRLRAAHWRWIAILCGIVLAATTPWDNSAVYRGIWTFDWQRTHPVEATLGGVLWRLPAEEYAFFLIETVMVALLTLLFLPRPPAKLRP